MDENKMIGRVIYVNSNKKFGFIQPNNRSYDQIFVSLREIDLEVDETVEFTLGYNNRGYIAENINVRNRNVVRFNTEDKDRWCEEAEEKEYDFVNDIVPLLNRNITRHPAKEYDKYSIDLLDCEHNKDADLKSQTTPFFLAATKDERLDPTYTVTFNKKDYERYKKKYPNADIYFHVNWTQTSGYGVKVEPINKVWVASFSKMAKMIENDSVYLHVYQNRIDDTVNARESYLFDLRNDIFEELLDLNA